jgi:lycopene beta-cyclase
MTRDRASVDARIVVLGSGVSGSLLVRSLAAAGFTGHVLLVDDGSLPIDDRLWASWRPLGEDADDPAVSMSRRRVAVASHDGERVLGLVHHRYVGVRGRDLRLATDHALSVMGGRRLEATAFSVRDEDTAAVVTTSEGPLRAGLVLDSVGLVYGAVPAADAWMRFDGVEVETDGPSFDPGCVSLMDFRVPQIDGPAFLYTLPSSATRALVEFTRITRDGRSGGGGELLARHLDSALGSVPYRVLRREAGELPLRPRRRRPRSQHCLALGAPAGLVKASTGYGYERTRRDSACIADQIRRGQTPTGLPHKARHVALDSVFLELAVRDPGTLTRSLELLFARNSADTVLRFLDERTSLAEEARLVSSLPVAPFVDAALRTVALEAMSRSRGSPMRDRTSGTDRGSRPPA